MTNPKQKKALMFAELDGKCEYCGDDMILSFSLGHKVKVVPDNLATFDHKYNRDHPLRTSIKKERRIYLVCYKCNGDKAKTEPNNQELNKKETLSHVKKFIPKEVWSDEKTRDKINEILKEEIEITKKISVLDNQIKVANTEKDKLRKEYSKKMKYRNTLTKRISENIEESPQIG